MRQFRRVVTAGFAVLLVTAGSAACSGTTSSTGGGRTADGLTIIETTVVPGTSLLPVKLAVDRGIFKKRGLDVRMKNGTDWSTFLVQLTKNQLQVSIMPPTTFLAGVQKKQKVLAFSGTIAENNEKPATACEFSKQSGIRNYADFAGKRIAVAAVVDSTSDSIRYLVEHQGADAGSIKFLPVAPDQQADQLKAGNVDIACGTQPYSALLEAEGFQTLGAPGYEAERIAAQQRGVTLDSTPSGMTVTSKQFADAHPEALRAWQDSLTEAIDYLNANQQDARRMAADWTGIPIDVINSSPWPLYFSVYKPEFLDAYIDVGKATGSIKASLPPSSEMVWTTPR